MRSALLRRCLLSLRLGPLAAAACAHAPAQLSADAPQLQRVVVTGSHVRRRVDVRNGLPNTVDPVTVWTPDRLDRAGLPSSDVGGALRKLDPAF
jgi:hypothetical protein